MKVLIINVVCGIRSTGRICTDLARQMEAEGHTVRIAYGRECVPEEDQRYAVRIGNKTDVYLHVVKGRFLDGMGFGSRKATERFISWLDNYDPDLIWLQNLHGYYINIELLFNWIKAHPDKQYRWTLHDCWAMTGHCAHFVTTGCERWKTGCHSCPELDAYPKTICPWNVKRNYERKKALFTGIPNMTLITPSNWLKGIVELSYLKEYPVEVQPTRIDTSIFKPASPEQVNEIREKYSIGSRTLILGAASNWTRKKGMDDFIKLSNRLSEQYVIILIGLDDKQMESIPRRVEAHTDIKQKQPVLGRAESHNDDKQVKSVAHYEERLTTEVKPQELLQTVPCHSARHADIIGIKRTSSRQEMALMYSAADVFVNMTYEDTLPTVNLEAEACGTRVITYDVGGCRETIKRPDSKCVAVGDLDSIISAI